MKEISHCLPEAEEPNLNNTELDHLTILVWLLYCQLAVTPTCIFQHVKVIKTIHWYLASNVMDEDWKLIPSSTLVWLDPNNYRNQCRASLINA